MTRYFQRVGQPGRIEHVEDHWPASMVAMEADPAWVEVTVSPVMSGDVTEEAACGRCGLVRREHRIGYAASRCPFTAAQGLLVGEDPEPGMLHRRFDGGRGTVLDDTGRVVGYLAGPRTVTDEQREAMREQIAVALADDWNPNRDPVLTAMFRDYGVTAADAALAALGFTVEERDRG